MKRVSSICILVLATLGFATLPPASTSVSLAQVEPEQGTASPSPDRRLQTALEEMGLNYEIQDGGAFKVGMRFEGDRTQMALIPSQTSTLGELEIRKISSIAHITEDPLSAEMANKLLQENANMKLGAWQTFQLDDQRYVTLFTAQIDANGSPETLATAIYAVLSTADQMEAELTGRDRF